RVDEHRRLRGCGRLLVLGAGAGRTGGLGSLVLLLVAFGSVFSRRLRLLVGVVGVLGAFSVVGILSLRALVLLGVVGSVRLVGLGVVRLVVVGRSLSRSRRHIVGRSLLGLVGLSRARLRRLSGGLFSLGLGRFRGLGGRIVGLRLRRLRRVCRRLVSLGLRRLRGLRLAGSLVRSLDRT